MNVKLSKPLTALVVVLGAAAWGFFRYTNSKDIELSLWAYLLVGLPLAAGILAYGYWANKHKQHPKRQEAEVAAAPRQTVNIVRPLPGAPSGGGIHRPGWGSHTTSDFAAGRALPPR